MLVLEMPGDDTFTGHILEINTATLHSDLLQGCARFWKEFTMTTFPKACIQYVGFT